jgi:hypothetical protein
MPISPSISSLIVFNSGGLLSVSVVIVLSLWREIWSGAPGRLARSLPFGL